MALVLYYVGHYLSKIDQKVLDKSNELDFPIIVMPSNRFNITYSDTISEIMEAIFSDNQHKSNFTNNMLERISQSPEHLRTLGSVMKMLSEHLKCTLLLVDTSLNCLHLAKHSALSCLSEKTILELFINQPFSKEIDFTEIIGDEEITVYRIPFIEDGFSHLSLIVVDEFNLKKKEELACAVEVLQLFSSIWQCPLDSIQLNALIPSILSNNSERVNRISAALNICIDKINTLFIIRIEDFSLPVHEKHAINKKAAQIAQLTLQEYGKPVIADIYNGLVLLILSYNIADDNDTCFISDLQNSLYELYKHFSFTICTGFIEIQNMQDAMLCYNKNIDTVKIIYPLRSAFTVFDLQFAQECLEILEKNDDDTRYYLDLLWPIYKQPDSAQLMETLMVHLLDAENDTKKTGEILFLHRNTVKYRINKINQHLNFTKEFTHITTSYTLYKAVAIERLRYAK